MHEEKNIEPEFLKRPKVNPFKTPDYYFESLEDRIMGNIEYQDKSKTRSSKVIQFLKPALGLAASFTLIYLLVYYPINTFLLKDSVKTEISANGSSDSLEGYLYGIATIDESSLVSAIFSDETTDLTESTPDEILAYLSLGNNDIKIYSEIQN